MKLVGNRLSILVAVILLGSWISSVLAVNYYEKFESPDVVAYTQGTVPAGWVKASQGYHASYHGLTDKVSGDFSSTNPANHQVIAFRYTNSGCTTGEDEIGKFEMKVPYTVSFDAVMDSGGGNGTSYNVQFMALPPGADRTDCRSNPAGAVILATRTGNAPGDGSFVTISYVFEADPATYAAYEGYDLTIRLKGSTTCASIDNIVVTSPPKGMVLIFK